MSGKLSGLMAFAVLLLCTILLSWFTADRNFRHQHLDDFAPTEIAALTEADSAGEKIPLEKNDYLLNEYLFRNLAGELLPCAPETFYMEEDGKLFQFRQSQRECARALCEYAVEIRPGEAGDTASETAAEEIITFVDYTYSDPVGRSSRVVIHGGRTDEEIRQEISRFEKSLYSYDYDSVLYGYKPQLNMLCFVDYFLL